MTGAMCPQMVWGGSQASRPHTGHPDLSPDEAMGGGYPQTYGLHTPSVPHTQGQQLGLQGQIQASAGHAGTHGAKLSNHPGTNPRAGDKNCAFSEDARVGTALCCTPAWPAAPAGPHLGAPGPSPTRSGLRVLMGLLAGWSHP